MSFTSVSCDSVFIAIRWAKTVLNIQLNLRTVRYKIFFFYFRYATPPQQIAAFNRRSSPETINDSKTEFLNPCDDTVFDTDILNLDPDGEFNIHFPMRRGEFYVHDGIGGSLTSVMADFQTIIEHALTEKLQINLKEIQQYKAVMVIPDIYNRTLLKEVMNLLIKSIGFGSAFLVQVIEFNKTFWLLLYMIHRICFIVLGSCCSNIWSWAWVCLCRRCW